MKKNEPFDVDRKKNSVLRLHGFCKKNLHVGGWEVKFKISQFNKIGKKRLFNLKTFELSQFTCAISDSISHKYLPKLESMAVVEPRKREN
jgi:hypothetical protein